MNAANPNLPLLESVVAALGPLCSRFVFVGGCVTGLLVTDAASPSVRATRDVDAIVQVVSLGEYHALERQLERPACVMTIARKHPYADGWLVAPSWTSCRQIKMFWVSATAGMKKLSAQPSR